MCKKTPTLVRAPAIERRRVTFGPHYSGERLLKAVAALALAALFIAMAGPAIADPAGTPTPNRVFFNCTFTIAGLRDALTISTGNKTKFFVDQIEASYIIVYVRANPNNGQRLDGTPATFTGPVVCTNFPSTDNIFQTPDTSPIPNATNHPGVESVDILASDETTDIQYLPRLAPDGVLKPKEKAEKRLCLTAGPNVDCFFIQPQPQ
jgi:hypothetical protein